MASYLRPDWTITVQCRDLVISQLGMSETDINSSNDVADYYFIDFISVETCDERSIFIRLSRTYEYTS